LPEARRKKKCSSGRRSGTLIRVFICTGASGGEILPEAHEIELAGVSGLAMTGCCWQPAAGRMCRRPGQRFAAGGNAAPLEDAHNLIEISKKAEEMV
jgi:hypothetical protein